MKITIEVNSPSEWEKLIHLLKELKIDAAQIIERTSATSALPLKRGSGKSAISYIADDFTAPLSDFEDYM